MASEYSTDDYMVLLATPTLRDRQLKVKQIEKYVRLQWIVFGSLMGFFTILNVTRSLLTYYRVRRKSTVTAVATTASGGDAEKASATPPPAGSSNKMALRRLPAAISSGFRIVAFRWTVWYGPGSVLNLSELALIWIYVGLNLMWTFIDTRSLTALFYTDRAAHIASSQVPLIIALSGKNSVISWATGIGHEKLNVLHRAAARTAALLAWVHAMQRYAAGIPAQWHPSVAGWMQAGVLALTSISLAILLSVRLIRNKFFEAFLVAHVFLVGLFIVGAYIHARENDQGVYYWPAMVIWAFDRVLRLGRLIWNRRGSPATIKLLGSDTIRVTMRRKMTWKAGQHAYVIMPSVSGLPSEAHPFTIASIPGPLDGTETPAERDVVFLIRGRSGFTQRLRERASQDGTGHVAAFIDGPYGSPPNLKQFTTCILVAGGAGVSYTLPLLQDLVRNARSETSQCRRVVFVWCVRDEAHLKWISAELMRVFNAAPKTLQVDARIYVTARGEPSLSSPAESTEAIQSPISPEAEKQTEILKSYSGVKTEYVRPNIAQILEDEVTSSSGRVSVDVAGPHGLASAVRKALASSRIAGPLGVLKGRAPVVMHTETFGMVAN